MYHASSVDVDKPCSLLDHERDADDGSCGRGGGGGVVTLCTRLQDRSMAAALVLM